MAENKGRKFDRLLLDYQILMGALITYWIALAIGLVIAFITDKLVFGVFFVMVIGISGLLTFLGLFYSLDLRDRINSLVGK